MDSTKYYSLQIRKYIPGLFFCSPFQYSWQYIGIKFADDWIRIADL